MKSDLFYPDSLQAFSHFAHVVQRHPPRFRICFTRIAAATQTVKIADARVFQHHRFRHCNIGQQSQSFRLRHRSEVHAAGAVRRGDPTDGKLLPERLGRRSEKYVFERLLVQVTDMPRAVQVAISAGERQIRVDADAEFSGTLE